MEKLAVLYAGNPLSIDANELQAIDDVNTLQQMRAQVRPNGDSGPPGYQVFTEAGRGDEIVLGTFETSEHAEFFRLALQWFPFFPDAVRELRAITENAVRYVGREATR